MTSLSFRAFALQYAQDAWNAWLVPLPLESLSTDLRLLIKAFYLPNLLRYAYGFDMLSCMHISDKKERKKSTKKKQQKHNGLTAQLARDHNNPERRKFILSRNYL